jgi:hypothetical protein
MHRVYNSAFMNFLKMEENAKFRLSLKNALEFSPEILKRYVNFMNNPDEETALEQFGGGDKYFAACTLLAALPGLPMFGHGQVEGFREKYGMEYRRAYLDERVDEQLLGRHERQVFPLLRRRALFSGVDDFRLYDFFAADGAVDENVIAFSNRHEGERSLVVIHNRFASTSGWIRVSAAFAVADPGSGPRALKQEELGSGLRLRDEPGWFVVFRDLVTGLDYIRSNNELCASGMFLRLEAYQAHVFLDFRELADDADGRLARLAGYLQGRGVKSLEDAGKEMAMRPLHDALRALCLPGMMERLATAFHGPLGSREENILWPELEEGIGNWASLAAAQPGADRSRERIIADILEDLLALRRLWLAQNGFPGRNAEIGVGAEKYLKERFSGSFAAEKFLVLSIYLCRAGVGASDRSRFAAWCLPDALTGILRAWGIAEEAIAVNSKLADCLSALAARISAYAVRLGAAGKLVAPACAMLIAEVLGDEQVQELLQVNRFQEDVFFNREAFSLFSERLTVQLLWELTRLAGQAPHEPGAVAGEVLDFMNFLPVLAEKSGYKLNVLQAKLTLFAGK